MESLIACTAVSSYIWLQVLTFMCTGIVLDLSNSSGTSITRKSGVRKRAVNTYLSRLPQELQNAVKQGLYHG